MDGTTVLAMVRLAWELVGPIMTTLAAAELQRRMRVRRWRRMGCLN
ncbi:MAG TPA: hypothetical protein VH092_18580 [Urbifossiella sp.]|jgi:hypothetical protein|nr:hypothetical protein [Urbifossiella sp.]